MYIRRRVRNGTDRKGAGRVAFPPPKVGVTRTLPYPIRHHSGDCSVAVPKTLAWANKEVETFVCILGEEDVVYDVYVAAAAIDIRPTTKGTVGSGNATSELSWANRSLPTAPLRSDPFRTLQWKCGIRDPKLFHQKSGVKRPNAVKVFRGVEENGFLTFPEAASTLLSWRNRDYEELAEDTFLFRRTGGHGDCEEEEEEEGPAAAHRGKPE
ncbi:unnamed protein product [Boreogadus saida]